MILVDTNIVLDLLLEREPFLQDAEALLQAIDFCGLHDIEAVVMKVDRLAVTEIKWRSLVQELSVAWL